MRHAVILKKESKESRYEKDEVYEVDNKRFEAWKKAGVCREATEVEARTGELEPKGKQGGQQGQAAG